MSAMTLASRSDLIKSVDELKVVRKLNENLIVNVQKKNVKANNFMQQCSGT